MNQLINHPQFGEIRVEVINKEPWFVSKDICDALGISNNRDALKNLDDDEKGVAKTYTPGGDQNLTIVNESGLYALIIRSNKPVARKFRKWVTSEVLPSIRKYGSYTTDARKMDAVMKRAETKAVKTLLVTLDKTLSGTDKRVIAKQCLTTEREVIQVLSGYKEDVQMMSLLYARATGNKMYRACFYSLEGAENLLQELHRTKSLM